MARINIALGPRPFPDTPRGRLLQRLGHYALLSLIVVVGLVAAGAVTHGAANRIVGYAGGFFFCILFYLDIKHDIGMCEWCIASMPLDAPERVTRHPVKDFLRMRHPRMGEGVAVIGILAAAIYLPGHGIQLAAQTTVYVTILCTWLIACWVHRKVEPFCPWCHPGDGDDNEDVPEPDPPPGNQLPIPAGGRTA